MKCSVCGKRSNSLKALGAHFRKKHAAILARRRAAGRAKRATGATPTRRKRGRGIINSTVPDVPPGAMGYGGCRAICYGPCMGGAPHVHG